MSTSETVIRSRFNRVLAVIVWTLCALMFVSAVAGSLEAVLRSAVFLGFVAYIAWLALWRPSLRVGEDDITVNNVTRTVEVPWEALIHVDTKYALTLVTPEERFPVWVAPAPGALASQRIGRQLRKQSEVDDPLLVPRGSLPGDLPGTDSGDAARIIREELERRANAGLLPAGAAAQATTRWNVTHGAIALALLVAGVTAALL